MLDLTFKQKMWLLGRQLLGGRPMSYIQMLFRDVVTGKMVNLYVDVYGRHWMATSRWGWDRVPSHSDYHSNWRGDYL